jgi:colicin import membrane protein
MPRQRNSSRERERERERERKRERKREREREKEREITDPGKTRNFASRIYRSAAAAGQRN